MVICIACPHGIKYLVRVKVILNEKSQKDEKYLKFLSTALCTRSYILKNIEIYLVITLGKKHPPAFPQVLA